METVTRPTPNCAFVYPATGEQCDIPKATHERKVKNHEFVAPAPQETPAQHSPLPWHLAKKEPILIIAADQARVADCLTAIGMSREEGEANAELIVKCVNRDPAFQKVMEEAQAVVDCFGLGQSPEKFVEQVTGFIKDLREALRLAREGEE